jgi:hypothetical protein
MPCSDSSSSITLTIDHDEHFISFEFAKITCGREITAKTGYSTYCTGKTLNEIVALPYSRVVKDLKIDGEEDQFVLYLEWDALRSAIAQYLGYYADDIDQDRCRITSIEHLDKEIEIAQVILPPKELPKILPCGLGDRDH